MRRSGWWECLAAISLAILPTACARAPSTAATAPTPSAKPMQPPSTPAATNPPAASVHAVVQELPQQAPAPDPAWETEQELLQAVKVARDVEPPDPRQLASALGELASWLVTQQRTLGARGQLTEALSLVSDRSLESDRLACRLQIILAESFRYEGATERAADAFRAAITTANRHRAELREQLQDAAERLVTTVEQVPRANEAAATIESILRKGDLPAEHTQRLRLRLASISTVGARRDRALALVDRNQLVSRRLTLTDRSYTDVPPPPIATLSGLGEGALVSGGSVRNAARVIAGMGAGFRSCYTRALATTPNLQGFGRITLQVSADGSVSEARAVSVGLPTSLIDCLLFRAGNAFFDTPEGGKAVVTVPVNLVPN